MTETAAASAGSADESASKDAFFARISALGDEMIAAHGRDFAMGALVLGARWIAEGGKPRDGAAGSDRAN